MARLEDVIRTLEWYGLMDVIVPFMLVFVVTYAILLKIRLFGEGVEKNRYYAIIALALALGVVIPHATYLYPAEIDPVIIINSSLPSVAGIMIAFVMMLILIGAFGVKFVGGGIFKSIFGFLAFGAVLYIFGTSAGWFPYGFWPTWNLYFSPETQSLIVIALVFGLIVYYITGGETKIDAWGKFKKALGEFKVEPPGGKGP